MTQSTALIITLSLELVACVALVLALRWRPPGLWRWVVAAACATLITHPMAWWANHEIPWSPWPRVTAIELAVAALEAALYWRLVPTSWLQAITVSVVANGASFGLGLVILWVWF